MAWRAKWSLAAGISLFMVIFALDVYPGLRGGGGWQWAYELPENWLAVGLLALVLIVYSIGLLALRSRRALWTLLWALIGSTVITFAVVGIRGDVGFLLFTRTVSPVQTGASTLAVRTLAEEGVTESLQRWTEIMDEAYEANLIHFTTSPPGQPLVHYEIARIFDSPALTGISQPLSMALRPYQCSNNEVMRYTRGEIVSAGFGWLMPLLAALAVFPLYFAAVDLTGNSVAAKRMVGWWALVPTIALFAPTWNTLYPALCILSFALLLRGLLRKRGLYVFAAGVVMSLTTLLNFAVLPILLLFGLFTLGYCWRKQTILQAVIAGVWFGVGLLSAWVLLTFTTGVNPLAILSVTFSSHQEIVQREYLPWLILHPYDVALFVGLPLFALALWGMWIALRKREFTPVDLLALAMGLTLLLVNLVGIVQGENGRILSFYAPFLLLAGLRLFADDEKPLFGAQVLTLLVMAAVLATVPLDLNPQPTAPRSDIGSVGDSLPYIPAQATFDSPTYAGEFRLAEYRYIGDPSAQAISFEFAWEGVNRTERPYHFEMVAKANNELDGDITADTFSWSPQQGNYLTTCWQPGDRIRDTIVLPLPPVSMPVVWSIEVQAVDERTGEVMQITTPDGATAEILNLQPVKYP